jgi:hypothetical protein
MTTGKPGVFEEAGAWSFRCECGAVGGVLKNRDEARAAYRAHRQKEHAVAGAIPAAPAPAAEAAATPEAEAAPTEKKSKSKKTKEPKEKKKPGKVTNGAVAKAWAIFEKNPKRKEALEACAAAGINPNTAKTQFFRWTKRNTKEA